MTTHVIVVNIVIVAVIIFVFGAYFQTIVSAADIRQGRFGRPRGS